MNKKSGITVLTITIVSLIFLVTIGREPISINLIFMTFAMLMFVVGIPLALFGIISLFTKTFNNRGFITTTIIVTSLLILMNIFSYNSLN